MQTDEALFGATLVQPALALDKFRVFGGDVPTMAMAYVGALKSWLYAPIFAVWPPSLWSIRLPMVLLGAGTILLFGRFLERLFGRIAAWVGVALLATDTSLVLTTTFDWGPVAIQHFLSVAMAWWLLRFAREDRWWMLALAAFLAGLALWNKAVFAWTLMGGGAALLLIYPVEIWRRATWRNAVVALVFFAGGASMLIRYNLLSQGNTWRSTANMALENLPGKPLYLHRTLDGRALMGFMMHEDNYLTTRFTVLPYVFGAAALAALALRRRVLLLPLAAGVLIWFVMAVTKEGGGSAHHVVLLYPLPHWLAAGVAATLAAMAPARSWVAVVLAAALAADNARLVSVYADQGRRLGGAQDWSDAIMPLAASVQRRHPKVITLYDWGMQDNLILLHARPLPLHHRNRPYDETAFTDFPESLWVGRVDERLPGVNKELFAAAEKFGYERVVLERIADRRGIAQYELFEFRKRAR